MTPSPLDKGEGRGIPCPTTKAGSLAKNKNRWYSKRIL